MPETRSTVPMQRRSARVLQQQNERELLPRKVKREVVELDLEELVMSGEEEEEEYLPFPAKVPARKKMKPERVERKVTENTSPVSGLSEYEQMVQQNIAERQKLLESMGILKAKEELVADFKKAKKKPVYRGIVREKKSSDPVVLRRSLRQQHLTPDGLDLVLPTENQVSQADRERTSLRMENCRPPSGPAPLMNYCPDDVQNTEECEAMLKDLADCPSTSSTPSTLSSVDVWGGTIQSVLKDVKKMTAKEEQIVKVVPSRIFSVQFHPMVEKTLVLVGGKRGQLGVLDFGREDESDGAYYFLPHSRSINCMSINPSSPQHVYTTSYDASFRQTDLQAGMVQEMFALDEDNRSNNYICWHSQQDTHNFLLGASLGRVIQVDTRLSGGFVNEHKVHNNRTVKTISVHPQHHHYYATGSNDGYVCLFDLRKHKKPLDSVWHRWTVCGLEFSDTGNSLISTSMDDNLRFMAFNGSTLTVTRKIRHWNQTGPWLTTFKARFVPTRDDLVYSGALKQPRTVQMWGSDGSLLHEFQDPAVTSVCSVVALHPFRHILAGCNSSGKVFVFM